ncbi:MAG: endonuclease domain-containing protein [Chakrabartia sp.]
MQSRAKHMRSNPTEPEKRLWRHLSNSQLGGFKFRRQEVVGNYIADSACPSTAPIVEVDGDTHDDVKDRLRDDTLAAHGWHVLHVTNEDVMRNMDGTLASILETLERVPNPHPNPSPEGDGLEEAKAHLLNGRIF